MGKANPTAVLNRGLTALTGSKASNPNSATSIRILQVNVAWSGYGPPDYAAATDPANLLGTKDFRGETAPNDCVFPAPPTNTGEIPPGSQISTQAVTDGSITGTGIAAWYAIVDDANSLLLIDNALAAQQPVAPGNVFSLPSFNFGIPGA